MFYSQLLWPCHRLRRAVLWCLSALSWCVLSTATHAQQSISLAQVLQRTLTHHPELEVYQWRSADWRATRDTASLTPAYELSLEVDNVAGTGDFQLADSADITLSLSSVIELGSQRDSRIAVADSGYALAQLEQQVKALDLMGQVTEQFILVLSLQEKLAVANAAAALAAHNVQLVDARVQRGAAPEVEHLRAKVMQSQTVLQQDALAAKLASRRFTLASFWQQDYPVFDAVNGALFEFETPVAIEILFERFAASPSLERFAGEQRLRDAELTLARSQSHRDLSWSLGIRRFQATDDMALTLGFAVPLNTAARNHGEVRAAQARRTAVDFQRDTARLRIRSLLYEAWQTYRHNVSTTRQIRSDIIPLLEQAQIQTRQAYQQGVLWKNRQI